ncbi:Hypothetical predicted protein [Octopus vulgaris]|uniref:Endonuclease/exonuclease/phosphatase domain-containing protein n=1 Tax=Octopus vulgaris TaxID=6645 RepID=A0AA36B2D3_OCTVU|nr:Hypothetical predicted protein [Octopus vulgaris]
MVPNSGTLGQRDTTLTTGEEHKDNHNSGGIDDADGTNPSGHLPADVATSELRSLRCTKVTKIGTWNVRGMNIGKLDTINKEMNRLNIDILGVSEVHWTGNGFFNSGDHTMYFSGNSKTRQHGVGFVLYKKISKCVESYQTMSDRVITIRIKAKLNNITLLQIYAPTADAEEDEIEQFYAEIQGAIEETPRADVVYILGDFNAKIGERAEADIVGKFGLGERNEAGDRLVQFCQEQHMRLTNTWFQQPRRRLYT